ncbi:hypothetical protein ALQ30_200520 [Pseudomonas syringae pv. persicae]|uniref:Uncharacterized protein n=1 Tax=Pseudomonas syringae pv. persicae TaxID=237306 RepID=A0A3M4B6D0_9PSED|nr:hypothetical protein ALQ30_200520 [Pseudomonas syringae pv. persicae]
MFELLQVHFCKRRTLSVRLHVIMQRLQIIFPTGFIPGVELHHPRRFIQFVKTVLQRIFKSIARFA